MRYLNLQNTVLISLLVAGVAATAGCSSGSDTPNNPAGSGGSNSGTAGSTGTAGQTSGTAGTTVAGGGGASSGTAGAGSGGTAGGNSGPSVCDGMGTRKLAIGDSKVDDFEGAAISPGWSSFNNLVTGTNDSFKIAQEAGGAATTAHSGHYKGMGAKTTMNMGYGVGTVFNVAIDKAAGIFCVDITAFDGVAFWGKAATAGSKVNLNFVLPETNQIPDNPMFGGGDCVKDTGCYSHPYKVVTLTTDWAQYSVAFADAGMGKLPNTGAAAKVSTRIQQLVWISLDADWDFSIDEIQFYKGTAPTGPVGGGDGGV